MLQIYYSNNSERTKIVYSILPYIAYADNHNRLICFGFIPVQLTKKKHCANVILSELLDYLKEKSIIYNTVLPCKFQIVINQSENSICAYIHDNLRIDNSCLSSFGDNINSKLIQEYVSSLFYYKVAIEENFDYVWSWGEKETSFIMNHLDKLRIFNNPQFIDYYINNKNYILITQ